MQRATLRLSALLIGTFRSEAARKWDLTLLTATARCTDVSRKMFAIDWPENSHYSLLATTSYGATRERDERATVRRRNAIFPSETNTPVLIYRYSRFAKYQLAIAADYVNNSRIVYTRSLISQLRSHVMIELSLSPSTSHFTRRNGNTLCTMFVFVCDDNRR